MLLRSSRLLRGRSSLLLRQYQYESSSTKKSWIPTNESDLQKVTTNAWIHEVAEQQRAQATRVVPWFLRNMPVSGWMMSPTKLLCMDALDSHDDADLRTGIILQVCIDVAAVSACSSDHHSERVYEWRGVDVPQDGHPPQRGRRVPYLVHPQRHPEGTYYSIPAAAATTTQC